MRPPPRYLARRAHRHSHRSPFTATHTHVLSSISFLGLYTLLYVSSILRTKLAAKACRSCATLPVASQGLHSLSATVATPSAPVSSPGGRVGARWWHRRPSRGATASSPAHRRRRRPTAPCATASRRRPSSERPCRGSGPSASISRPCDYLPLLFGEALHVHVVIRTLTWRRLATKALPWETLPRETLPRETLAREAALPRRRLPREALSWEALTREAAATTPPDPRWSAHRLRQRSLRAASLLLGRGGDWPVAGGQALAWEATAT